jgi:hypothetical protein
MISTDSPGLEIREIQTMEAGTVSNIFLTDVRPDFRSL